MDEKEEGEIAEKEGEIGLMRRRERLKMRRGDIG